MLIRLNVASWVGAHVNVIDHPGQHWVPTMGELALQRLLQQFIGWRGHIFEALPKRHHRETSILEVLAHLDRTPLVESDLSDIKPGAKILNELLDIPVVHHVPSIVARNP